MKLNRRRCRSIALFISVIPVWLCDVRANDDVHETLLARAERFEWLQNWDKARPLYEAAEKQFMAAGDPRKAALSRIGLILSRIYTTDSLELLALLGSRTEEPSRLPGPESKVAVFSGQGLSGGAA